MPSQDLFAAAPLQDPRVRAPLEEALAGRDPSDPGAQDDAWAALVEGPIASGALSFDDQLGVFQALTALRAKDASPLAVWRPTEARVAGANATRLAKRNGVSGWEALRAWSVQERAAFWAAAIEEMGIRFAKDPDEVLAAKAGADLVEDPDWLPGARLNIVESCFGAEADAPAIVFGGEADDEVGTWTYGALRERVDEVAAGLRAAGFAPGNAIGLYMPMTPECVAAYLGIIQAGCAAISIADSFSPKEVAMRLRLGQARGIVTVDVFERGAKAFPMYEKARAAIDGCGLGEAPRCIVIHGAGPTSEPALALVPSDLSWARLVDAGRSALSASGPVLVHAEPDMVTNILFSSGTTGEPKAIPWTHLTPIKCGMDGRYHQDIHAGDVVAWPTNIGWMMGPWLIYATLLNQGTIALFTGAPNTAAFCRFVQRAGVSMLGVVPALVKAWRSMGAMEGVDWSGVRTFSSTGEASNAQDYLWLMAQAGYGAPVIEYCGGTEIGGGHITGTVLRPASPATFSTSALGLELRILAEDGSRVEPGGDGTLFLVPPSIGLSQRLLNRDHHEEYFEGCPMGPAGETLRRHGDAVHVLHGGYWRAEGRADDTMNLGGIKVSSLELERVVEGDASVSQAAAIAVPPAGGGAERLVFYVVPEPSSPEAKARAPAAWQAWVQKRISAELNPLFRVHEVRLRADLPRTASNKVMRRTLRAEFLASE